MRIFPKLLLALLLTSFALLILLYTLMQWGIDRGMLNYANQRQVQSLQLVAENLAAAYQAHNGWQKIIASSASPYERNINKLAGQSTLNEPSRKRLFQAEKSRQSARPNAQKLTAAQRNYTDVEYWRLILRLSEQGLTYPEDIDKLSHESRVSEQKNGLRPGVRKGRRNEANRARLESDSTEFKRHAPRIRPRYSLLDAAKQPLIGQFNPRFMHKAIIANGDVVGYVALPRAEQITDKFDLQFVADINQQLLSILAGVFLIIIFITIVLSRHFVRPIARLKNAVVKVNQGELSTRLTVNGHDELATLARNFNDLAATLQQNEASRKRWLADIAHELRTPLAIVKGELEAMEDGIRPLNIAGVRSVTDEVSHLQRLINDLNELNQAEIGAMRYQKSTLDFANLVSLSAERHRALLASQGLALSVTLPNKKISLWGDATRINQLLDNLFANSAKYTDAPGQIYCRLIADKQQLHLWLEDSKPGVIDADLEKLFDHLYRVDNSRNRKNGGSGIGLALCKNIVHAHQGSISAHASEHGGLAIKITFPSG